ncbi:hypothetical protein L484_012855 [Morus notabilis]|uniref:Disease resistance R13L4/SHOC-2-like LRR domain-containing protein n=1 Tax=Morus notabilis TaxID=981085 RepID=W9R5B8_9ROSA|nr:hypothetical protein L484_012855 [Morus notabilis]
MSKVTISTLISIFNVDKLIKPFLVTLLKRFKHLRVLNFHRASLDELPDEMGNLFHLKYLSLGDTKVKTIPKSIGKLPNLRADIRYSLVNELPSEINKLRKLRHLLGFSYEKNSFHGVRIQGGVGELSELHALSMVKARSSGGRLMMDLEKLTQMRQLGISELNRETGRATYNIFQNPIFAAWEYLALQGKLEKLPSWIPELKNLQKLALSCARLTDEPLTSLKDMPHLVYLNLDAAYGGEELHFEKCGFQKLKELNLKNLRRLKLVKIDVGALSLLEKLEIGPSHELKEVPNDFTNLGKLKYLDIWGMPTEFAAATKPGGLNIQKIKHVAHVRYWRKQGDGNYVEDKLPLSHPLRPNLGGGNYIRGGYGYG